MKYLILRLKRFCGFIAGFVFFIAGVFKLLDPVGAGLVMKEYMDFLHVGFLAGVSKPLAVLLALLEAVLGAALVTGVWRRITALAAMIFQSFFVFLTFALVIFNPDMDCGCFGEVMELTHWETFIKNIFLLLLLSAFAFPLRYLGFPKKRKYVSFAIVTVSVLIFTVYSWMHIPFVDYTDFKPAAALQAGNAFSSTDNDDIYDAVFVYEKDGKRQDFTLGHLPDSSWTYVQTRTELKEEYEDGGVSLSFWDTDGNYKDTLATQGKVMVVSFYDVDLKPSVWKKYARFVSSLEETGFVPVLLMAESPDYLDESSIASQQEIEYLSRYMYYSDRKTLMTLNRSNGGVTYFSDGYLITKWAARSCPDLAELQELYSGDDTEVIIDTDTSGSIVFQGFLLYVFAVMLLL